MIIGVIGGGASGMMAAIRAAQLGHQVTIIEHNNRVGKKILATGNGRCNYTNMDMSLRHFHGTDKSFIDSVLKQFDNKRTLEFFDSIGVYPKEKNGYIYPYSEQASAVLDCLRNEIIKLNINVLTECIINDIVKINTKETHNVIDSFTNKPYKLSYDKSFLIITNKGKLYFDKVILAAGSKASEKTGSDGSGYRIAKAFGHKIKNPLPALCALKCNEDFFKSIAGVRCKANIKLVVDNEVKKTEEGELQITDYGISGIPVFQVSYIAAKALEAKRNVRAIIDFMPDSLNEDELFDIIIKRIKNNPSKIMDELLIGLFNKNLCILFNKLCNINGKESCSMMKSQTIHKLAKLIKSFEVSIRSTNGFENAQVCSGGIKLEDIKSTMESKLCDNLYFCGEIIDVNGDCGGYNLQWAWSSGYVAGCLK